MKTWVAFSALFFSAATVSAAPSTFDLTSVVGAAHNSLGEDWACVLTDDTHVQCAYRPSGGSWTWCDDAHNLAQPYYYTYSSDTGVYLVQDFTYDAGSDVHGVVFVPAVWHDTETSYWGVYRFNLGTSVSDCAYNPYFYPFPYIGGNSHPDVGHHLAVAAGNHANADDDIYVFSVAPSSDAYAAGALLGVKFSPGGAGGHSQGMGAATDLYNAGDLGIATIGGFAALFDPDSPIGATKSSWTGLPVVGVRDSGQKKIDAVYSTTGAKGSWLGLLGTAAPANANIGAAISLTNTPVSVNGGNGRSEYDSFFSVDSANVLLEQKFEDQGGGTHGLSSIANLSNNGNALDSSTDSLGASWFLDSNNGNRPTAQAFARRDSTHADSVFSYFSGAAKYWFGYFSGSGWASGDTFAGMHTVVRLSSYDDLYGVCSETVAGVAYDRVCHMNRTHAGSSQTWEMLH